jgi:hypothetical protein
LFDVIADESETFWKKHHLDFSASGLTRAVYCKTQAINYDRFGYWIRKLSSPAGGRKNHKQASHQYTALLPVSASQIRMHCREYRLQLGFKKWVDVENP